MGFPWRNPTLARKAYVIIPFHCSVGDLVTLGLEMPDGRRTGNHFLPPAAFGNLKHFPCDAMADLTLALWLVATMCDQAVLYLSGRCGLLMRFLNVRWACPMGVSDGHGGAMAIDRSINIYDYKNPTRCAVANTYSSPGMTTTHPLRLE
jgi:hypothetical protein